jgi:hypothetical protein
VNTTTKHTMHDRIKRREFLRWGGSAAAGLALLLAGCGAPAGEGEAALSSGDQGAALTQERTPTPQAVPATPQPTQQQGGVACPFRLLNDPYPGRCKRYSDRNGNGVCDYSEPGSGDAAPVTSG